MSNFAEKIKASDYKCVECVEQGGKIWQEE